MLQQKELTYLFWMVSAVLRKFSLDFDCALHQLLLFQQFIFLIFHDFIVLNFVISLKVKEFFFFLKHSVNLFLLLLLIFEIFVGLWDIVFPEGVQKTFLLAATVQVDSHPAIVFSSEEIREARNVARRSANRCSWLIDVCGASFEGAIVLLHLVLMNSFLGRVDWDSTCLVDVTSV